MLETKGGKLSDVADSRRELVQRIAASPQFRKSPRMRELLFFITDRSLQGQVDELTEHNIGCAVFGRNEGYDPAEDNIVRVSARQLRSKLKEYFQAEGASEEVSLEIPRGAYVPVFKPAGKPDVKIPDAVAAGRLPYWIAVTASAIAVVALAAAIWLWRANHALIATFGSIHPTLVGELLLKSNQPVSVVMSDATLVSMTNMTDQPVDLEDYASRQYLAQPPFPADSPLSRIWMRLSARQTANVDDVVLVSGLLKAHPDHRDQILIRQARNMNLRDFNSGQFLIQGGPVATPWVSLFQQQLDFRFERVKQYVLRNLRPRPGEQAEYTRPPTVGGAHPSYARIALVPNLSGTGKVLLVAGLDVTAGEAAAKFALSPDSIPLVRTAIGGKDLAGIRYLELLLETSALDKTGYGARIIAVRH